MGHVTKTRYGAVCLAATIVLVGAWAASNPQLTLEPDADCYSAGDTVTVDVNMLGQTENIVGGQFFLEYDPTVLTFVSMDPGDDPFVNELYEAVDTGAGTLDYAVHADAGHPGTSADTTMAVITFTARQDICNEIELVTWRPHDPPTRLSDDHGNAVNPELLDLNVIDDQAPVITCPSDVTIECDESTDPSDTGEATATDNCDASPAITYSDVVDMSGCGGYTGTITRTWTATDYCDNFSTCDQIITVVDTTAPVLDNPPDVTVECDESTDPADTGQATATDNCDPAPVVTYSDSIADGTCPQEWVITRTWRADDACDNFSTCDQIITVVDTTPPVLGACPDDITVNADAGGCTAVVTWTDPTATDNCDPEPTVACEPASGATFPQGSTIVTCTATDACGNSSSCTFTVTVLAFNELVVDVELSPIVRTPLTRCITFELWECDTPSSVIVEEDITFIDGLATEVSVLVPCGNYTCITARDTLHTLRRTDDTTETFGIVGTQYVADFTDKTGSGGEDDRLVGGNLNDDRWVDSLDYGIFTWQYGWTGDPDTPCGTPFPHADINGDGVVNSADFTFIQINFQLGHEANCCGQPGRRDDGGPITRISVDELEALGLRELARGDLNHDGWLDTEDIALFAQGVRPGPATERSPTAPAEHRQPLDRRR